MRREERERRLSDRVLGGKRERERKIGRRGIKRRHRRMKWKLEKEKEEEKRQKCRS